MTTSPKDAPDFSNWSCPLPLADYPTIVMGHGGGGKLGTELVEHLFLPAFRNPALENLGDAAVLDGSTSVARTAFAIGSGEWARPDEVGIQVVGKYHVVFRKEQ